MSASPRKAEGRRLKSFRLSDVPLGLRLAAKEKLLKTNGSADGMLVASLSFADRLKVGLAAEQPSPRVYWVSQRAWDKAMRSREARR